MTNLRAVFALYVVLRVLDSRQKSNRQGSCGVDEASTNCPVLGSLRCRQDVFSGLTDSAGPLMHLCRVINNFND